MNGPLDITPLGLSVTLVFILLAGAASAALRLGLGKDLLVGTVRTIAQLYLMAFVLRTVFAAREWYICLLYTSPSPRD